MAKTGLESPVVEGTPESKQENPAGRDRSEEGSSDERKSILVRISSKAKAVLERAAADPKTGPTTYSRVVEALLDYYDRQGIDAQEKIMHGIDVNPLKESEDLLARLHRAEHAVVNKRYYFAIKTYRAIADQLHGLGSSEELLEVCNYRLGHCWLRLSYGLRVEALADDFDGEEPKAKSAELYQTALRALDKALSYLDELIDGRDPLMTLIKHYNMACCYSLKAQFLVESSLDPESKLRASLRDARKDLIQTQNAWENIGETWRRKNGNDSPADAEAQNSLDQLRLIYSAPDQSNASSGSAKSLDVASESSWCAELAAEDTDLVFLRWDEKWKTEFNLWQKAALQGDIGKAAKDLLEE